MSEKLENHTYRPLKARMYRLRDSHPWYPNDVNAQLSICSSLTGAFSTPTDTVFHANFVTQRVRVPQEIYASKDRTFKPRVISAFRIHGAAGIPLAAILRGETEGLEGRALPALPDDMTCTKVSLRILWPGYEPFTKQIMIRTGGRTVSMDRLVEVIAKVLVEFCQKRALVPTSDPAWRLGPGSITVDDMTLVGILHVSRSSIQPLVDVLVRRPSIDA